MAKHEGLRAWFEVLRTSREGPMPKYEVCQEYGFIHCSSPECGSLTIGALRTTNWGEGNNMVRTIYLFSGTKNLVLGGNM